MLTKNKIEEELEKFLPKDNILSSLEECYVYSQDGTNTRKSEKTPDVVIFPETIEEVQHVVKYANLHDIPVTARGAGTNLIGACLPDFGGIVMNFSKMNKIKRINKTDMTAIVQPGVVVGDLQKAVENHSKSMIIIKKKNMANSENVTYLKNFKLVKSCKKYELYQTID